MQNALRISPLDHVAVLLQAGSAGQRIAPFGIGLQNDIPFGHKVALADIHKGQTIFKYGYPIGCAIKEIKAGEWVHTHNVRSLQKGIKAYEYSPVLFQTEFQDEGRHFDGFLRKDGSAGIRNELFVLPMVGCINGPANAMVNEFKRTHPTLEIDGVSALTHPFGCSQLADDLENTRNILAGIARNPNAGGVLVLSLGCENNDLPTFIQRMQGYDPERVRFLCCQSTSDEISSGVGIMNALYALMTTDRKVKIPYEKLKIGLKCGGSDAFSGMTANPILGRYCDYMAAQGAACIFTEITEIFGAEEILMQRALSETVFNGLVRSVDAAKSRMERYNIPVYANPSPGNLAGGITTLEEKALGNVQKSGRAGIADVLSYGERSKLSGVQFLDCPASDVLSTTALGAAGCQLVLFTTGRGTPTSNFIPTVKIASNSKLAQMKSNWIDFDASGVQDENNREDQLSAFINDIDGIINGKHTRGEDNAYCEIAIYKSGITL